MNPFIKHVSLLFLTGALLLSAGCVDLKPQNDPTRYFILPGIMGNSDKITRTQNRATLNIGLKRIEIPNYLNSPLIMTRRGDNEIVYSEFNRWGNDLERSLGDAITKDLVGKVSNARLSTAPWPDGVDFDHTINIRFQRFDGDDDGNTTLLAQWEIASPGSNTAPIRGETRATDQWDGRDYADLVAALSRTLEALGNDLALAIESLAQ